jgi:hypothetical protein
MCKNGRNRCSPFVAMDKNGEINEAIAAFVRMVDKKEKEKKNAR